MHTAECPRQLRPTLARQRDTLTNGMMCQQVCDAWTTRRRGCVETSDNPINPLPGAGNVRVVTHHANGAPLRRKYEIAIDSDMPTVAL